MTPQVYDIVVAGGSLGGVMAAYAAAKQGFRVLLTEATAWIGGQLTNQGVPSDEHPWIESFGCTRTYRQYRERVRTYYRQHPHSTEAIQQANVFNPGSGWVSAIAHEPRVAWHLLNELLLPFTNSGALTILTETNITSVERHENTIVSLTLQTKQQQSETIPVRMVLDATDTGDLLPLSGAAHVWGSEGKKYDEPHATTRIMPNDMQPITWVAAIGYKAGSVHMMERPKHYDYFRSKVMRYGHPLLSWFGPTLEPSKRARRYRFGQPGEPYDSEDSAPPLFSYRQIINRNHYNDTGSHQIDTTLVNWPQNDYVFGNIFNSEQDHYHRMMARELTLSLIYWLKTEAPREDGSIGYPEIMLRKDVLGTNDGLAMAPYIRESRRMITKTIITEHDVSATLNPSPRVLDDSIGIGSYPIDLHMTTETQSFFYASTWPFEIPLGSLISTDMDNLIPACKNIGTTHVTNGCFRLHPVEWNIGEVAGHLAAYCLKHQLTPQALHADKTHVKAFQSLLDHEGIERHWPLDKIHAV